MGALHGQQMNPSVIRAISHCIFAARLADLGCNECSLS